MISAADLASRDPAAPVVALDGLTMGTGWRVLYVPPSGLAQDRVRGAIEELLDRLVAEMSHWEPGSLLSRFNAAPAGSWWALPPDFATVIAAALEVAEASDGAFDPAIGRLVNRAGFGPPAVAEAAGEGALAASGWRRLRWDAATRRLQQPSGLSLDLSGIAKGYAVDAVSALLARLGVAHALVEIGGELAGRGVRPDGEPWWVDLELPPGIALPPLRVALHGLAVATSGDYRRGAHTLDPRTGGPATGGVVSASVIHSSAMLADAWATALTVAGAGEAMALASAHGLAARLIRRTPTGAQEIMSPALAAMLAD